MPEDPLANDFRSNRSTPPLALIEAMPIYEYACGPCGKTFEELIVRRSDEAEVKCPSCGNRDVGRQMSRPAAARVSDGGSAAASAPACGPIG